MGLFCKGLVCLSWSDLSLFVSLFILHYITLYLALYNSILSLNLQVFEVAPVLGCFIFYLQTKPFASCPRTLFLCLTSSGKPA